MNLFRRNPFPRKLRIAVLFLCTAWTIWTLLMLRNGIPKQEITSHDCLRKRPVCKNTDVNHDGTNRTFPSDYRNLLSKSDFDLCPGGHHVPACPCAGQRVAIIVPYRRRESDLYGLLYHLHTLLPSQSIEYRIYLIEQIQNQTFNRAKLLNVGYVEAQRHFEWDCVVLHDVDMYPESDETLYTCGERPRRMVNTVNGESRYRPYLGGVVMMPVFAMEKVMDKVL